MTKQAGTRDIGDVRDIQLAPAPTPSGDDVENFRTAFFDACGERLELEEAASLATSLLRLMYIICRPRTPEDFEALRRRRQKLGLCDILDP